MTVHIRSAVGNGRLQLMGEQGSGLRAQSGLAGLSDLLHASCLSCCLRCLHWPSASPLPRRRPALPHQPTHQHRFPWIFLSFFLFFTTCVCHMSRAVSLQRGDQRGDYAVDYMYTSLVRPSWDSVTVSTGEKIVRPLLHAPTPCSVLIIPINKHVLCKARQAIIIIHWAAAAAAAEQQQPSRHVRSARTMPVSKVPACINIPIPRPAQPALPCCRILLLLLLRCAYAVACHRASGSLKTISWRSNEERS